MAVAHFAQDYPVLVDNLLEVMSEDEAMARAVGSEPGTFERFGYMERRVLELYGFDVTDAIVDIGCGSGRLAAALVEDHQGIYAGFDIVDKLVEYADRNYGRENFHFFTCEGLDVPLDPNVADYMTFFSVFSHLHHEETYLYLHEAMRVLRPGGTLVCSYLDFEQNWGIFQATARERSAGSLVHANVFMSPDIIRRLVEGVGFEVLDIHRPLDPFIEVPETIEFSSDAPIPPGNHPMGQGVCIARKPERMTD